MDFFSTISDAVQSASDAVSSAVDPYNQAVDTIQQATGVNVTQTLTNLINPPQTSGSPPPGAAGVIVGKINSAPTSVKAGLGIGALVLIGAGLYFAFGA